MPTRWFGDTATTDARGARMVSWPRQPQMRVAPGWFGATATTDAPLAKRPTFGSRTAPTALDDWPGSDVDCGLTDRCAVGELADPRLASGVSCPRRLARG